MPLKIRVRLILLIILTSNLYAHARSTNSQSKQAIFQYSDTIKANLFLSQKDTLLKKNKYKEALELAKKAQEIYKANKLWHKFIETGIAVSGVYIYYDIPAMLASTELTAQQIKTYGITNEELISKNLNAKATALLKLNNLSEAKAIFSQIIPVFKTTNEIGYLIDSEWSLALIDYYNREFIDCKSRLNKLLKIEYKAELDYYRTPILNLLATINYKEGDYQKAISLTSKITNLIENKEQLNLEQKYQLSGYYKNLGTYFTRKGEYSRALDYYKKIPKIINWKEDKVLEKYNKHYNNIANILRLQGEYRKAIPQVRKTLNYHLPILKKNKKNWQCIIDAYIALSSSYYKLEQLDSVSFYTQKSLDAPLTYKKNFPLILLARVELAKNNATAALKYLERSIDFYHSTKKKDLNYLIDYEVSSSNAHEIKENYSTALKLIQKYLITNSVNTIDTTSFYTHPQLINIVFPSKFLTSLNTKAQLLTKLSQKEKDQKAALETYQLAIQWIDTLQNSYVLEGSQLFWSKKYKEVYGEAIDLCYQFYQQTNEQKYLKLAFDITEKSKALLLLEGLKDTEGKAVASLPDSLIQKEKDLKVDLAFYEKSLQTSKEKKQEERIRLYQGYLADTRLNLGNLKEQMEVDYPDYYQLKYANTTISIPEIQSNLIDPQSALIQYFLGETNAYVFTISKNHQTFTRLDLTKVIQQKSEHFLQQLKNPSAVQQDAKLAYQNYNQAAFELYQVIMAAATKDLPTTIKHLVITPDDVLNNLPFEVLTTAIATQPSMDFGTLPYLFDTYQIHYAYSANLLWKNQQRQALLPANANCYAVAPPYKDKGLVAERGSLAAVRSGTLHLDGTGKEIQGIANYFEGDYDSSSSASKANFINNAQRYGLLHLAMHGEASGKDAAHLIFTNLQTDTTNDNLLYHYEIANMDLTAQMAVLSACETGVGEYVQGEGVFSLARSFMYAGVPSLAMTLWKVNDGTTSILMPDFYKNLSEGMTKTAALHTAKKQFSKQGALEYRHPYYWSGFVLLGDGGVLKIEISWWLYGAGGLMLFLIGLFGFKWFVKSNVAR